MEAEGLTLAEGERDLLALELGLAEEEGLAELEGDILLDGERDTLKDCIHISQFSRVEPETFLNSNISPKTLPVGCGP